LERIHGCILLLPELHFWVGLALHLDICAANEKVPYQKPGMMVGHLYSTVKRLVWGCPLEKRKSVKKNFTSLVPFNPPCSTQAEQRCFNGIADFFLNYGKREKFEKGGSNTFLLLK